MLLLSLLTLFIAQLAFYASGSFSSEAGVFGFLVGSLFLIAIN